MFQEPTTRLRNKISGGLFITCILLLFTAIASANQHALFRGDQLAEKQLIQAVLASNPSIEAMQSARQAAESRVDQATALDDPMLSYSFAPSTIDQNDLDFGQKMMLSQKLPWPGKRALRGDSARLEANASQENVLFLRLQLIETSAKYFADWYSIHEAVWINRINQDLWQEFHDIAEVKYGTGQASQQDVLRAEVEQARLEHQAIVLNRKQQNILAQINTLLNRTPDTPVPPPAALPEIRELPDVEQLRKMALETHPALKALIARNQASDARLKLAEREYYPDFNVNAGYNSLWNQDEKRFTIGVGINIPLLQGKRDAKVSEQRARSQQNTFQIADKQAEIAGAVQRSYNNVEESRHVLKLYESKLLTLAEENLLAAKADYQSGAGGFLDLVSAEKNLFQTRLSYVKAQRDYHQQLALLSKHVGDPSLVAGDLTLSDPGDERLNGESNMKKQNMSKSK
ncbi:MAG: hypothetical protein BMS9Abin25_0027 [Gammaproteobacteria bacterium]|nr:MAG: hypothetical protein BMS9Abin25_0027 [Gammaproteobacteria bacterium]